MPMEYRAELVNTYLLVEPGGVTSSVEEMGEYLDRILGDCEANGTNKILMDHRKFLFDRKVAGSYELAARCIDRMSPGRPMKVALLTTPERMELARLYEMIGVNRGVEIKTFDSKKMASAWLSS